MTIKEARTAAGLSRPEMSRRFEIPVRTLENWEAGVNRPPIWAEKLIIEKLENIRKENERKMKYQVTEWYMNGENGEIAGTFDDIEDARKCLEKCITNARKTEKECKSSYIDICPVDEDDNLGDPIETHSYEPVRN